MSAPTTDHAGRVYLTVNKNRSVTAACPHPWTSVSARVLVYGPSGVVKNANGQALKYTVQPCASVQVQAMPTGAALVVRAYGYDDRLLVLDAAMSGLWDKPFDTGDVAGRTFPSWMSRYVVADNNGNIVTITPYWRDNQTYRGTQIAVLNGTNGVRKSVVYTDQLEWDASFGTPNIGLARGRLYVGAHVCNVNRCTGSDPYMLYAVSVVGLGMDYPRARVLGQSPVAQTPALKYVALGDSYSAGFGIEPYASNDCHRSELAYAELLDEMPGLDLELQAFVACTSATTVDVENGKGGEPSQLNALNAGTDIATITIGGNDVEFVAFATECVSLNCSNSSQYHRTLSRIENRLPGNLDHLFAEISERIGVQTRVLVLGYPRLMPYNDGTWPNCLLLSQEERAAAQQVTVALNGEIKSAVTRAGSQFKFVDADANWNGLRISPFAGHELCNDYGSYFFGVSLPVPGVSFHPNRKGAGAYAELVYRYLAAHP